MEIPNLGKKIINIVMLKNPLFNKSVYCKYKLLEESSASSKSSMSSSNSSNSSSRSSLSSSLSSGSSLSSNSSGLVSSSHNTIGDILAYRFATIPVNINSDSENENPTHQCPLLSNNKLYKYLWNTSYDSGLILVEYKSIFDSLSLGTYKGKISACGLTTSGNSKEYDFPIFFKILVTRSNGSVLEYTRLLNTNEIVINVTNQNIKSIRISALFSTTTGANPVSISIPFVYNVKNSFSEILDISPNITL